MTHRNHEILVPIALDKLHINRFGIHSLDDLVNTVRRAASRDRQAIETLGGIYGQHERVAECCAAVELIPSLVAAAETGTYTTDTQLVLPGLAPSLPELARDLAPTLEAACHRHELTHKLEWVQRHPYAATMQGIGWLPLAHDLVRARFNDPHPNVTTPRVRNPWEAHLAG